MNIRGISAITSASEIIQPKVSASENEKNDEGSWTQQVEARNSMHAAL